MSPKKLDIIKDEILLINPAILINYYKQRTTEKIKKVYIGK